MTGTIVSAALLLVLAEPPADDDLTARKVEAGQHLDAGNRLLEQGQAEEALAAYRLAYEAFPSPKIEYNIAEALAELGSFMEAARSYQVVVDEVEPSSPLVASARERLDALDTKLARLTVASEPSGAEVTVRGRTIGTTPLIDARVMPGTVDVGVTVGDQTETMQVELTAGESRAIRLALANVVPPPDEISVSTDPAAPVTKQWWFWALVGGGVLVVGTAVGVGIAASGGHDFVPMGELGVSSLAEWEQR